MRDLRQRSPRGFRAAARGRLLAAALLACAASLRGANPTPTVATSGPGRFEIAAIDASITHAVAALADEAWRALAAPLALPEAFPSPVFVRVLTEPDAPAMAAAFHAAVEPGGVVSLRIRWSAAPAPVLRRALVQALLLRLAVARHGAGSALAVPLWLEHGCVGLWQARGDGAQLDALKHEAARLRPPPLAALLRWERGGDEPREWQVGAAWLVHVLQAEAGPDRAWPGLLSRVLGGEPAEQALGVALAGAFSDDNDRELWWQTAWHQAVRARTLPALDAADSRGRLAALARFVFAAGAGEADVVVPLGDVLARAREPIVAAELVRRAAELGRLVPALHPFYRNAGLSLAAAMAARGNSEAMRAGLVAVFEADWRDATELEAASSAALDALERKAAP